MADRFKPKHTVAALGITLAGLLLWRPIAIQYHKIAMHYSQEKWESWSGHQQALISLGYLQVRDFQLNYRTLTNNSDLMRLVDSAPFRDQHWTVHPTSNRVSVTAYEGDMRVWEGVIEQFDRPGIRTDKGSK